MISDPTRDPVSPGVETTPSGPDTGRRGGDVICGLIVMAIAASILLAAGGHPALAAAAAGSGNRAVSDKWNFTIGSFLTDFKTDAAVGSGGVIGTIIRLEDDLGFDDDDTLFRFDGIYRFNSRHSIGFGFWTLNRDGNAIINEEIEFDGDIFEVGADLQSSLDLQWIRAEWRYSFLRTDRGEAGILVGISAYDFEMAIEGVALIGGVGMPTQTRAQDDFLAPVPTVGFFVNFAIKPNLVVKLNASFLDLEFSDIEGNVVDTTFLIEWYFSRHVGVGLGAIGTDIDIRDVGDDPFSISYDQSGLVGYFTFAFGEVDR